MKTNARICSQYHFALPNAGNATVLVEQKVNGVYQYLTTQQTQTTSGLYEIFLPMTACYVYRKSSLPFGSSPNQENIRISVSGTSGFALQQISLERDNVDTLVNTYLVSRGYRYGFQGQEKDDDIKGNGNSVNYEYRMHDPRIGRFFAVDPIAKDYPWNSPYTFSENTVINAVELEGLEIAFVYNVTGFGDNKKIKKSHDYDNYNKFNQRVYRYFNSQGEMYQEMVQKLDDKGKVTSYEIEKYGVDGDVNTKPYSLSNQTQGKKTNWYDGTILSPDWGVGGHDGANLGGWGGSKEKELKYGLTAISAIVGIGTGGISLIIEGATLSLGTGLTVLGISSAADDIAGLFSSNGQTPFQNLVGEKAGSTIKLTLGFVGSKTALIDYVNNMDDVTKASVNIISFVNDQGNTYYGVYQQALNDEKNEK